jgi:hypothetical protein
VARTRSRESYEMIFCRSSPPRLPAPKRPGDSGTFSYLIIRTSHYARGVIDIKSAGSGLQACSDQGSSRGIRPAAGLDVGYLHMFTRRALSGLLAAQGLDSIKLKGTHHRDMPRPLRSPDFAFRMCPNAASIPPVHARRT